MMELIDDDMIASKKTAKDDEGEDSKSNQGTLKRKSKEEKEKRKLEKENEKFLKQMEKKEKDMAKREKAREKKEQEQEKKTKEKEKKEIEKQEKKEREKLLKEEKKSTGGDIHEELGEEDPRIGTLNKISALFHFSKLNRKEEKVQDKEINEDTTGNQTLYENVDPDAPPLPPKPAPNSPIMRNVGTRLDV